MNPTIFGRNYEKSHKDHRSLLAKVNKPIRSLVVIPNFVDVGARAVIACGKTKVCSNFMKLVVALEKADISKL